MSDAVAFTFILGAVHPALGLLYACVSNASLSDGDLVPFAVSMLLFYVALSPLRRWLCLT